MKNKIYLDTSVISALFDDRNPDRQTLTKLFFENIERFDVYISELTVREIDATQSTVKKDVMRKITSNFKILPIEKGVEELTQKYLEYDALPSGYAEDAYHIGIAVINGMDYLLSWNFKHLVRLKTKDVVRMVNTKMGYRQIEIITPAEIL
jgi:predicted nucleic acid-binding protein